MTTSKRVALTSLGILTCGRAGEFVSWDLWSINTGEAQAWGLQSFPKFLSGGEFHHFEIKFLRMFAPSQVKN
jgi:hypothetical protein